MEKVERYDWAKPGDKGHSEWIDCSELRIDRSYQRDELPEKTTLDIARAFNWSFFGCIVVMRRVDGTNWVVDGQQRLAACRRRGDIKKVPCLVFSSNGPRHEAAAFSKLNTSRNPVRYVYRFQAEVVAGLEPQKTISAWLKECGFRVGRSNSGGSNVVDFPLRLMFWWGKDPEIAKQGLLIERQICEGDPIVAVRFAAICFLLWCGIPVREHIERLRKMGGVRAIDAAMAKAKWTLRQQGGTFDYPQQGLALLGLINKGLHNKLKIGTELSSGGLEI